MLVAAAVLVASACSKKEEEKEPEPLAVKTAEVRRGSVTQTLETAGTLEPPPGMDVKLGALTAGRIGQVLVTEGDRVAQGQLLARLDATPLRDAVAQAEAQLAQARAQESNARGKLDRAERAFAAGVAAKQEVDDARLGESSAHAAVQAAQAALSTARNQLGRSELRAPFAGVIAHVFSAAGEPADAGKPIVEIARTAVLELRAPLAPAVALQVRKGQRADVRADGLPGSTFPGVVIAVAAVVDATTGTALARIRVENPDGVLKGGTFARARIAADVHPDALLVPREALLSSDGPGASSAFAVEKVEDGKAKRLPVEVGYQDDVSAEISKGLAQGDRVVVGGAYALPDGTRLKEEPDVAATGSAPPKGGGAENRPLEPK